ncbi:uncharacterized protein N7496_006156 [Penicillium cataractarum]|uniref:Uncharacterized protein n=1 Tax=Penicillium cataractarum TaxID=2100454 RepID=A0A9W9S2X4_9EURO|nr:uncharacterized protein N7496_006156 [Penicillium cataractarum]KAJ5370064.1 hypothetical protein N7496_006156 [Penicillium cataractarum]
MSTKSTNNAPHSSKLANKLHPRVNSDTHKDISIKSELGDARNYGKGGPAGNAGPRSSSNIANKLDPRVASGQDDRAPHEAVAGSSYANSKAGYSAAP